MLHGATPTLYFKINSEIDFESIDDIWITIYPYGHNGGMLTKTRTALEIDEAEKVISFPLSQEETLNIHASEVDVQMKILMENGQTLVSEIFKKPCGHLLNWNKMLTDNEKDYYASDTDLVDEWDNTGTISFASDYSKYASPAQLEATWNRSGSFEYAEDDDKYSYASAEDLNTIWGEE